MSNRPAFRDLLTADAVLMGTVLKDHVSGQHKIAKVIETAGTFYASTDRTFHVGVKNTELIIYDAVLTDGHKLLSISKSLVRMVPISFVVARDNAGILAVGFTQWNTLHFAKDTWGGTDRPAKTTFPNGRSSVR